MLRRGGDQLHVQRNSHVAPGTVSFASAHLAIAIGLALHSTICQPDDSHAFGRTFGGRPAREATDRRAQREPPWRQKFKLPPLRAERRRCLALVWESCGTRPTRCSRHPGDVPVGLDPQLSMSKKKTKAAIPRSTPQTELRCRTPWLNCSSVFAERNFITTISSATTTTP